MPAILRRLWSLQSRLRKIFLGDVSGEPLLSKKEMSEAPSQPSPRRHVLDGGYTMALLAVAIVAGYGILASSPAPAKTIAAPPPLPPATVASLVATPVEAPQSPRPAPIPEISRTPEPP